MPFALLSLYFLRGFSAGKSGPASWRSMIAFATFTVGAAMFTERAAIMIIMAVGFYLIFFPSLWKKPRIKYVLLSIVAFLCLYLIMYFACFYAGIEEGGSLLGNLLPSPNLILSRFAVPGFVPFVLVNLMFLGFLIPFSGFRCFLLVVMAMTPNILINVGGAEFNNWLTHYHTMYIPFIIFAASIGFHGLVGRFDKKIWGRYGIPVMICVCVFISARMLNPYTGKLGGDASGTIRQGIMGRIYAYYFKPSRSPEKISSDALKALNQYIPPNVNVSALEGAMPALYKSRSLSYYPINMDKADYLVIGGTEKNGKVITVSGAICFLGAEQSETLNRLLYERLTKNGFLLHRAIRNVGVLIFKRTDKVNNAK
jgi:hypothetical protein